MIKPRKLYKKFKSFINIYTIFIIYKYIINIKYYINNNIKQQL